jgi:hypothetical protein
MSSPFRYRKKYRERLRRHAKKQITAAQKFEAEGIDAYAALSRRMAEISLRSAHTRRRKKSKRKNPT